MEPFVLSLIIYPTPWFQVRANHIMCNLVFVCSLFHLLSLIHSSHQQLQCNIFRQLLNQQHHPMLAYAAPSPIEFHENDSQVSEWRVAGTADCAGECLLLYHIVYLGAGIAASQPAGVTSNHFQSRLSPLQTTASFHGIRTALKWKVFCIRDVIWRWSCHIVFWTNTPLMKKVVLQVSSLSLMRLRLLLILPYVFKGWQHRRQFPVIQFNLVPKNYSLMLGTTSFSAFHVLGWVCQTVNQKLMLATAAFTVGCGLSQKGFNAILKDPP